MEKPKPKDENTNKVIVAKRPVNDNGAIKTNHHSKDYSREIQELKVRTEGLQRISIEKLVEDLMLKRVKELFIRLPLVGKSSRNEKLCQILVDCSRIDPTTFKTSRVSSFAALRSSKEIVEEELVFEPCSRRVDEELKLELFKVKTFHLRGGEEGRGNQEGNGPSSISGSKS